MALFRVLVISLTMFYFGQVHLQIISEEDLQDLCLDHGMSCAFLTKVGYCRIVPAYMSQICKQSCGFCDGVEKYDGLNVHIGHYSDSKHGQQRAKLTKPAWM